MQYMYMRHYDIGTFLESMEALYSKGWRVQGSITYVELSDSYYYVMLYRRTFLGIVV